MVAVDLSVLEWASPLELLLLRSRGLPLVLTGKGVPPPFLPYLPFEVVRESAVLVVTARPCRQDIPARVLLFPRRGRGPGLSRLADLLRLYEAGCYEAGLRPREEP